MNFIQTHGLILLGGAFVFALVVSAMPPLPASAGWWTTFFYKALQVLAANADKVAHGSAQIQQFTRSQQTIPGQTTTKETATSIPVALVPTESQTKEVQ